MISIETQLAVFLDNRPGTLARTCQALAKDNVNILALSISDSVDHAVVRMVVSDAKKAVKVLQALHATVQEREVIFMDVPNQPGMLARVAEKLAEAGINIEYAYCTSSSSQEIGNLVLRTNDIEATIDALS
jgi:hypothetical protein